MRIPNKNSTWFVSCAATLFIVSNILGSQMATGKDENRRPNVLFILIDDFGWKDVGYNGSTFYETPRIDALAKDWMRFNCCYTASPMCSPTRLSILTGKNPARHGVTQWLPGSNRIFTREGESARVFCPPPQSSGIDGDEITLGEAFQAEGYDTAFYGKWHMGPLKATGGPTAHGYEFEKAIIESNRCSMFYPFRNGNYFPEAVEGDNFTDLLTDAAIEFVTEDRDSPYYLHLCFFAMHAPIGAKPELRERFQEKLDAMAKVDSPDRELDEFAHRPQKLRQDDVEYAGELANLDTNIGRLIDAIRDSGELDNTIIFLTGDNGGRTSYFQAHPTSNQPLRTGKTFLFEGGIRTPLLVHWPEHDERGMQSDFPIVTMDFYPTLLEMAGIRQLPDQHVDGQSIVPLFSNEPIDRGPLYWHFPHYQGEGSYPSSAIRVSDLKLVYSYQHDDVQLFDLVNDPHESKNIARERSNDAANLKEQLFDYLLEVGAYLPGEDE